MFETPLTRCLVLILAGALDTWQSMVCPVKLLIVLLRPTSYGLIRAILGRTKEATLNYEVIAINSVYYIFTL